LTNAPLFGDRGRRNRDVTRHRIDGGLNAVEPEGNPDRCANLGHSVEHGTHLVGANALAFREALAKPLLRFARRDRIELVRKPIDRHQRCAGGGPFPDRPFQDLICPM